VNAIDRINKLASLLSDAGGKIETRKKLHKLVYLLQAAGEDFDQRYMYCHYGPFSATLAADLERGVEDDVFCETYDENAGFTIRLLETVPIYGRGEAALSEKTRGLLDQFKDEDPQLLEVLGTIVFLARDGYTMPGLKDKLAELKPGLTGHFDEAFSFANQHFSVSD